MSDTATAIYLYQLPSRANPRPKIYGLKPNGNENGVIEFDHVDGAYSYCEAFDDDGNRLGPVHLHACTPLVEHGDGYEVAECDPD